MIWIVLNIHQLLGNILIDQYMFLYLSSFQYACIGMN